MDNSQEQEARQMLLVQAEKEAFLDEEIFLVREFDYKAGEYE